MAKRCVQSSLNRRDFIATTTATALSYVAARADTTREGLAACIHPDVQIVRDELARDANAFWDWKDASDKLTSLWDFSEDYFRNSVKDFDAFSDISGFHDAIQKAEQPAAPFPQKEAGDCVRAWLDASKEPTRLVQQGIAKERFQVPQELLFDFIDNADAVDSLAIPRDVARLKTVQCSLYLNSGEEARAVKSVADLLNMGRMTLSGDGYLVHYLVAMAVYRMALNAVNAVVFHSKTTHDSLREIRRLLLQSRPEPESLARVFRVEVVYFTQHEVARLPQTDDLPKLVDALIERNLTLGGDDPDVMFSSQEQVARVRKGLLKLLDGHPKPFDAADTLRLYSGVVAMMLNDVHSPWLTRKKELAKASLAEIKPWPEPLSFINDLNFSLFGEEKEEREVTNSEIEEARKALLRIKNPVGKQMLHYVDSFECVRRSYHTGRLQTDISLLLIASRMFRDKERRLPHDLSELVDAKLIESVPIDPFSGQDVRYDSQRRLIWSFGMDEEDNGGDWDFDAEFPDGKDLVWRIPATPA